MARGKSPRSLTMSLNTRYLPDDLSSASRDWNGVKSIIVATQPCGQRQLYVDIPVLNLDNAKPILQPIS